MKTADIIAAARKSAGPTNPGLRKRQRTGHEFCIQATDSETIERELAPFWKCIETIACSALSEHQCNVLICSLSDSGHVTATFAQALLPFRFPRTCSDLDEAFEHFHIPTDIDFADVYIQHDEQQLYSLSELCATDAEYDVAFNALTDSKLKVLRQSAMKCDIASKLENDQSFIGTYAAIEAESLHESNLVHVFGSPLPPPEQPQTAPEVFSRLYQPVEERWLLLVIRCRLV